MAEGRRLDVGRVAEVDRRTLGRCRQQDPIAFRAFVVRYERPLFALLSRMIGRGPHVQDLAQDAFLRAFEAFPRFDLDGAARPSTWLLTIGTRLALDWLKRRAPDERARAQAAREASSGPNDKLADRRALGRAIERAAAELSDDQRAVLILSDLHELTLPEIVDILEIPEGTVKSRLSRAREHMRARLAPLRR